MPTDIVYIVVISLVGLLLSARLGLGLLMQSGRMKIILPLLLSGYVSMGFYLGNISESKTLQSWLSWIFEGDRLLMLQAGEVFLCIFLVALSLRLLQSMEGAEKGCRRFAFLTSLLMAPSPFVFIWVIFSVGNVQMAQAGWKGHQVGMAVVGALLLFALLVRLIGKLTRCSAFSTVFGFILLDILLTVLVVFLPAAMNLPNFEALAFSLPSGKIALVFGIIILIIGIGFFLSYRGRSLSRRYQNVRRSR